MDTRELAQAARRLGVVNCEQLYLKAAACGDTTALRWFTRRLVDLRRFQWTEQIIEEHCLGGFFLGELSGALGLSGHYKEGERLARRAYEVSGNRNGHRGLATCR
ncbi:hypothetical protein AB0L83_34020 [Streptomyces sp. NPDC052071]|uniref:hypothetical protein n=1 Tax=Streptomyces TaxID=1883 RepID=UPI0026E08742|nr:MULTISPECIES: hypothetical protein [unclassified Streptomyces]MDX2621043.1 hypothetical protein [Streptomyces sp. WI03-5b]MDX3180478.1 hypothetical protein [Streptomyces sp. ME02-7008A-1]MDX3301219.1 hypothetical protein [Streptomyces sp. ME02-7008A]WKV76656.1 hypothetical protein HBB06_00155 [Streptomyces sp. SNU607]